ncbi:hypothetical protein NFI96_031325 [Prochilodus magdalenae]|nr:hypothetical protein NFI96_031325 [Prochilodus magdalenae]
MFQIPAGGAPVTLCCPCRAAEPQKKSAESDSCAPRGARSFFRLLAALTVSISQVSENMPSVVSASSDNLTATNNMDEGLEGIKVTKKKDKTLKKKKMAPTEEPEECEAPAPKKIKKEKTDTADGASPKTPDLNGNVKKKKLKVKNSHSSEELVEPSCDQSCEKAAKKKKPATAAVNGVPAKSPNLNGHSADSTPAQSSEDSGSDSEKETETPEQREGAFSNFRISPNTVKLLEARGVKYLFDIQVKTFNPVYDGKDVIGQARTGTGKTFSFAIPLVEKLQTGPEDKRRGRAPKVLVLAPTRELAIQVAKDFKDVTRQLGVFCFYGGTSYNPQVDAIRNGIDILVGTPGRIKDHLQNNKLDLSQLKHVVLDEVDQMLDMGFAEQVEEILSASYTKVCMCCVCSRNRWVKALSELSARGLAGVA